MKIALIDNDRRFRSELKEMLQKQLEFYGLCDWQIDQFSTAEEYLEGWPYHRYAGLILETDFPGQNGIDLTKTLRFRGEETPIIFCSASNRYAMESYDVGATWYVQKPVTPEKVDILIRKLVRKNSDREIMVQLPDSFRFSPKELYYVNYSSHRCLLYMSDQSTHSCYLSVSRMMELLDLYECFFQVRNNVIINMRYVASIIPPSILMQNGHYISVARRKLDDIRLFYKKMIS